MSEERKRIPKAPIAKPTPRARVEAKVPEKPIKKVEVKTPVTKGKTKLVVKPEVKIEEIINPEVAPIEIKRKKPSDDKYVRFASSEFKNNHKTITDRVIKEEIKFAYFAVDGEEFYYYYLIIKK